MILFIKQRSRCRKEDFHEVRHSSNDPERAQDGFLADVSVRRLHQLLDLARQVAGHLGRRNRAERAERKADDELCWAVEVTKIGK